MKIKLGLVPVLMELKIRWDRQVRHQGSTTSSDRVSTRRWDSHWKGV